MNSDGSLADCDGDGSEHSVVAIFCCHNIEQSLTNTSAAVGAP